MEFRTKTSIYDLSREQDYFVLRKISVNVGNESDVKPGEVFKSFTPAIMLNKFVMFPMATSQIVEEDLPKVMAFITGRNN